jgi:hypothetical protein
MFGFRRLSMRRLAFDPFEFDSPDSEESLELAVSTSLAACGASARPGPPPTVNWDRWPSVVVYVRTFAGVELPPIEGCRVILLNDEWDDLELAVAAGSLLVWYHWWTTA